MLNSDYSELHKMIKWARANNVVLPQAVYDLNESAERLQTAVQTMATNGDGIRHKSGLGVAGALEAVHRLARYVAWKQAQQKAQS